MSTKKDEILGIRMDPKMKKEIEVISKALHISPSEWVRNKIAHDIQEATENMKYQIVMAYLKGTIDRQELEEVFGEMSNDVDFVIEKVRKDFVKSEELSKKVGG